MLKSKIEMPTKIINITGKDRHESSKRSIVKWESIGFWEECESPKRPLEGTKRSDRGRKPKGFVKMQLVMRAEDSVNNE